MNPTCPDDNNRVTLVRPPTARSFTMPETGSIFRDPLTARVFDGVVWSWARGEKPVDGSQAMLFGRASLALDQLARRTGVEKTEIADALFSFDGSMDDWLYAPVDTLERCVDALVFTYEFVSDFPTEDAEDALQLAVDALRRTQGEIAPSARILDIKVDLRGGRGPVSARELARSGHAMSARHAITIAPIEMNEKDVPSAPAATMEGWPLQLIESETRASAFLSLLGSISMFVLALIGTLLLLTTDCSYGCESDDHGGYFDLVYHTTHAKAAA